MEAFLKLDGKVILTVTEIEKIKALNDRAPTVTVNFVAEKLKALRKRAGLSATEVAEALGYPETLYRTYEDAFDGETYDESFVGQIAPLFARTGKVDENDVYSLSSGDTFAEKVAEDAEELIGQIGTICRALTYEKDEESRRLSATLPADRIGDYRTRIDTLFTKQDGATRRGFDELLYNAAEVVDILETRPEPEEGKKPLPWSYLNKARETVSDFEFFVTRCRPPSFAVTLRPRLILAQRTIFDNHLPNESILEYLIYIKLLTALLYTQPWSRSQLKP